MSNLDFTPHSWYYGFAINKQEGAWKAIKPTTGTSFHALSLQLLREKIFEYIEQKVGEVVEETEITNEEVLKLMKDRNLNVFQVIDVIIESNHLIGVGLIDLENLIVKYIHKQAKLVNKTPNYPEALND